MRIFFYALLLLALIAPLQARAEFTVTAAVIEFTADDPRQKDIELVSHSPETQYIDTAVREIVHPGGPDETRKLIDDPTQADMLVTPNKIVLEGQGRRLVRFVTLNQQNAAEHIYRVALQPAIKGVKQDSRVGLKVLIGYEVLVIVRPDAMKPAYTVARSAKNLTITNTGNTSILFQYGRQCASVKDCKQLPAERAYPGRKVSIPLVLDAPASYSVWDGKDTVEKVFD